MDHLERTPLFTALTRPQLFAGVTYNYFLNGIIAAELFLILRSFWVLPIALAVHAVGMQLCLHEPRIIDLWLVRVSRCPRVPNHSVWRCNSYRP